MSVNFYVWISFHPPFVLHSYPMVRSRDSPVSIVTRLWDGRPGFDPRRGKWWDFFSYPPRPDQLWDPPSFLFNGYRGSFPGVKAVGAWSYTSTPQNVSTTWCLNNNGYLMLWYLFKHTGNLTFILWHYCYHYIIIIIIIIITLATTRVTRKCYIEVCGAVWQECRHFCHWMLICFWYISLVIQF
jgi:hypothetical protein